MLPSDSQMSSVITNSLFPLDLTFPCVLPLSSVGNMCVMLIDRPSICHSKNSHINEFVISGFSFTETLQKTVIILVYIFYIWAHRILINQMSFGLLAACLEIYCQRFQLNSSRDAQSRFWNRNSASAIQPSLTLIRRNHLEDYKEKEWWARRHHEPSWNEMAGKV